MHEAGYDSFATAAAPAAPKPRSGGRLALLVAGIWLCAVVVLIGIFHGWISRQTPFDPDDFMRMVQVRDWLDGQSWWDVTQYRMNPPTGGLLQWSRIPDLPIAALELLLRPFGRQTAEMLAAAIVPLLLLGALLAAVALSASRMFAGYAAPAAAMLLTLASGNILIQFVPTRVDHHGWQILMAALALAALLDRHPRRSGLLAGAAFAVGLAISIEGAIIAAAALVMLAIAWLADPAGRTRLVAYLSGWAAVQAAIFAATRAPSHWGVQWCDQISSAHVAALAVMALGVAAVTASGARLPAWGRALGLVLAGGIAGGVMLGIAPSCAAGPFAQLDPFTYRYWYLNLPESMPIWRQTPADAVNIIVFALVGLFGAGRALLAAPDAEARRRWAAIVALGIAGIVAAMLVRRAGGSADILAVPGATALILELRARAARLERPAVRALVSVAAFVAPSPLLAIYLGDALQKTVAPQRAIPKQGACDVRCQIEPLARIAPGRILAGLDLAPAILFYTPHGVLAGSYHRNDRAIAELMRAFAGSPDVAHRTVLAHHLDYVVFEPDGDEANVYHRIAPGGFGDRLAHGSVPVWLTPVPLPGSTLKLWRVIG